MNENPLRIWIVPVTFNRFVEKGTVCHDYLTAPALRQNWSFETYRPDYSLPVGVAGIMVGK